MNYQLLKTEIEKPEFAGKTDAEIATILNAPTVEYFIDPPTPELQNFMFGNGTYMKLLSVYRTHADEQVRVAAECAIDMVTGQIATINISGNANIQQMLALMVYKGVFTQADSDAINDFPRRFKSRAEADFGAAVTETDIARAKLQDKEAQLQTLIDANRQRTAVLGAMMIDLRRGVDVDLDGVS